MSDLEPLNSIRIVLINTSHPGNIGAAARAMKNMGLGRLYLVEPKHYPAEAAVFRAASAVDVLDNSVVCDSLDQALEGVDLIVGTSARSRRIPWPLQSPRDFAESLPEYVAKGRSREIAILFGREDRGLTNDELQRCGAHIHIPSNDEYSSLNIAMAVQLICYELRVAHLDEAVLNAKPTDDWDSPWATDEDKQRFYVHLEKTLVDLDFLDPAAPRQLMTRLRRLFGRIDLDQMEVNILRGILTAAQAQVTAKVPRNSSSEAPAAKK
ncbi:MAG: RNA methyltransferase [Pseudomonadales bacterium]